MSNIVLVAETGSDIPPELAQQYRIHLVPMHVSFGEESRADGTFPAEEICAYYERTGTLPKTSASTPEDFSRVFDEIHRAQPDSHILYLAYSAVTTCSYQSAQIAAEGRSYVTSVDTKSATAGQYAVVMRMARLLEQHPEWTPEQSAETAQDLSARARMCFVPKDMEYLRAGGRVSNATALCGKLLGIHPLIEIQDGYLLATKKLRGKLPKIAAQLMAEFTASNDLEKEALWLIRTPRLPEEVVQEAEQAAHACGYQNLTWVRTGGVITTHGGPGTFGIAGFAEK